MSKTDQPKSTAATSGPASNRPQALGQSIFTKQNNPTVSAQFDDEDDEESSESGTRSQYRTNYGANFDPNALEDNFFKKYLENM